MEDAALYAKLVLPINGELSYAFNLIDTAPAVFTASANDVTNAPIRCVGRPRKGTPGESKGRQARLEKERRQKVASDWDVVRGRLDNPEGAQTEKGLQREVLNRIEQDGTEITRLRAELAQAQQLLAVCGQTMQQSTEHMIGLLGAQQNSIAS
jgi:hypothetical protein